MKLSPSYCPCCSWLRPLTPPTQRRLAVAPRGQGGQLWNFPATTDSSHLYFIHLIRGCLLITGIATNPSGAGSQPWPDGLSFPCSDYRIGAENSSELITSNWSGATLIRVSRRTRQFTDSDLTDLLTATLQRESVKDRGELELHLTRPWAPSPSRMNRSRFASSISRFRPRTQLRRQLRTLERQGTRRQLARHHSGQSLAGHSARSLFSHARSMPQGCRCLHGTP